MNAPVRPFDFDGARALVVGGGTGLGAAMAEALAAHGASLCIASRTQRAGARHDWIALDVRDSSSVAAAWCALMELTLIRLVNRAVVPRATIEKRLMPTSASTVSCRS